MTINELLYDAIKYEETFLAYSIYWSLNNGLNKPHESAKSFYLENSNVDEVKKLIEENPLGIQTMKLYSMAIEPYKHLIVLAEDEKSAKGHYLNEYGYLPRVIHDMTTKLDTSFWHGKERGYKTFREIRDETLIFPSTVMEYDKTERGYEEVESEYLRNREIQKH